MKRDKITGLSLVCVAIVYILLTATMEVNKNAANAGTSPRFFPYIAGISLLICGSGILIRSFMVMTKETKNKNFFSKKEWTLVGYLAGVLIAFPLVLKYLGFIPASLIVVFALSYLFSMNQNIKLLNKIIYTIVVTASVYCIFTYLLKVRLPEGLLANLL